MSFLVLIKQEAHEDVLAAYVYYEEKQPGLGDRFLTELQQAYDQLAGLPSANGFIAEDTLKVLRDVKVNRFPYVIVYEIIEQEVVVYAVHNTYKHPRRKLRRV